MEENKRHGQECTARGKLNQEARKENMKGKTHPSLSEKVKKVVSLHCRDFTVLCK